MSRDASTMQLENEEVEGGGIANMQPDQRETIGIDSYRGLST